MSEIVITVQGSARSELPPEQALVRFTIAADGAERSPIVDAVSADLAAVTSIIESMHNAERGPIVAWSADQVSASSHRPWTNDGTPAALVHRASVSGRATVGDPLQVAGLLDALAARELVSIDTLQWSATDARLERERDEVRTRAVADALAKAEVLAAAIGLGSVTALALADPGMLDGGSSGPSPLPRAERAMLAMDAAGGGLSLRPEPIVIEVAVDARFSAR